jgi:hypothetical protein
MTMSNVVQLRPAHTPQTAEEWAAAVEQLEQLRPEITLYSQGLAIEAELDNIIPRLTPAGLSPLLDVIKNLNDLKPTIGPAITDLLENDIPEFHQFIADCKAEGERLAEKLTGPKDFPRTPEELQRQLADVRTARPDLAPEEFQRVQESMTESCRAVPQA